MRQPARRWRLGDRLFVASRLRDYATHARKDDRGNRGGWLRVFAEPTSLSKAMTAAATVRKCRTVAKTETVPSQVLPDGAPARLNTEAARTVRGRGSPIASNRPVQRTRGVSCARKTRARRFPWFPFVVHRNAPKRAVFDYRLAHR